MIKSYHIIGYFKSFAPRLPHQVRCDTNVAHTQNCAPKLLECIMDKRLLKDHPDGHENRYLVVAERPAASPADGFYLLSKENFKTP